ncbi:MAG: hypothetical protein AB9866_21545 [Syntrophobacteraceae bacterium]
MILGPSQLNHLIEMHGLVTPYDDGPITKDSIDLRVGTIWKHHGGASLLSDAMRDTGTTELINGKEGVWTLQPNTYYLAKTIEAVSLPSNVAAICMTRSTIFRSGVLVTTGYIDPGYFGEIHFGFTTPGSRQTQIAFGFKMLQLIFSNAENISPYSGIYQGGKTGAGNGRQNSRNDRNAAD